MKSSRLYGLPILFGCLWLLFSCKKESFVTDSNAYVYFSTDTLKFDTVFTTTGSITQSFKIFNPNDGPIRFSSIKLMGGNTSPFHININGLSANLATDVELDANDSMYVFVSLTAPSNNNPLPFIVSDSILISWNGNQAYVQLQAYGKNAFFLRHKKISSDTTWNNTKPIVLLDSLFVDPNTTLTIQEGTEIYVHAQSPIIIQGSLQIEGTKNNEVIFRGDRLDEYYRDLPGSWPGILFTSNSSNNQLRFVIIRNAIQSIKVEARSSLPPQPILSIHQCVIDHASDFGIWAKYTFLEVENSLIRNCNQAIHLEKGGSYQFTNCTAGGYSTPYLLRTSPLLEAGNASWENNQLATANLSATFQNCIFWGEGNILDNELNFIHENGAPFNVQLDHCLYKNADPLTDVQEISCLANIDPLFDSINVTTNYFDFHTGQNPLSPVIDQGTVNSIFNKDLDDFARLSGLAIDLGCYERP